MRHQNRRRLRFSGPGVERLESRKLLAVDVISVDPLQNSHAADVDTVIMANFNNTPQASRLSPSVNDDSNRVWLNNDNAPPTGEVTISGTPRENETLTAANTLADEDGLGPISYQWQRDGVDISGATGDSYTLTQADVGALITVVASYTDGQGTLESVSSAAVGPVLDVVVVPVPPSLVQITRQDPIAQNTNADTLQFRAEFTEPVQNVDANDFVVSGGSTASIASVVPVQGTGEAIYLITVSGGDLAGFNGQVGIDLSPTQDITDLALNALLPHEPPVDETYTLDNTAPQVNSVVIDDGTAQRSMVRSITVNFDSPIVFDAGAFDLRTAAGNAISLATNLAPGTVTNQVVLTFPGTTGGSLADGNYQLRILATHIGDIIGNALDGDADGSAGGERAADEFFRLFGDVNGDRVVGALDAFQLRQALSVYNDDLDIDNDGLISAPDISQFRNRLGTSL